MEDKHYVCEGSCGGVSDNPGVCESEDCENHGMNLVECTCTDGMHSKGGSEE